MTVEDAVRNFLRLLVEFLNKKGWIDDTHIELEYDPLDTVISCIREAVSASDLQISNTLDTLLNLIGEQEEEDLKKDVNIFSQIKMFQIISNSSRNFEGKIRHFSFVDVKGAVISKSFFENKDNFKKVISDIDIETIKSNIFEFIVYLSDQNKINNFLNFLFELSKENSLLLIKKDEALPDEELYSFLYLNYLAKGYRTLLDSNMIHNYGLDPNIENEIQSLSDLRLSQFFEILDVFDEYQHSTDILIKFLKLYQMIEYLLIRVLLVRIQQRIGKHKQFLRELMGMKKHDDFDKKLFRELYENEKSDLKKWFKTLVKTQSVKDEIERYTNKSIDITQNSDEYWLNLLADLIYQLRNSIVHNKESEYHITIHTTTSSTATLLREILSKFEKIILEKLIEYDEKISYTSKELMLY